MLRFAPHGDSAAGPAERCCASPRPKAAVSRVATPAAPSCLAALDQSLSPLGGAGRLGGLLFAGSARYARQGLSPLDLHAQAFAHAQK